MDKNNSFNQSKKHSGGEAELSPRPAPERIRPTIHECFSCADNDCGLNVEIACGYDDCDNSAPRYCRRHYISHLAGTHPKNQNAQDEARKLVAAGKFPEGASL